MSIVADTALIDNVTTRLPPGRHAAVALAHPVRRACIDIGSNTTRLLVADCDHGHLREVHQERAFTRIGRALGPDHAIARDKIDEVVAVVAAQRALAVSLGARTIRCVATASVRRAANAPELVERIRRECDGLDVEVVSGKDEARLAFLGAVRTLARPLDGRLVVVDVGGGSSELVVGTPEDGVQWWASVALGSGTVADAILASDPPGRREFARARELVSDILRGVSPPPADLAVAVGGSATSLLRLVGPVLDSAAFARSLELLGSRGRAEVATAFDLDVERVRLMPAGLLILEGVSKLLGMPLHVGQGGLREGALLEAEV